MEVNTILQSLGLWASLLIIPFFNFDLLWRMIPVYLNGFLASIYFGPSNTAAVFGGLTALWAGADWIRGYIFGQNVLITNIITDINWIIAIIFSVYGILSLTVGIAKIEVLYHFFGRRSILTYFAIFFYPVQAGYVDINTEVITIILVMAIPTIIFLEIFAFIARKHILKLKD